MAHTQLSDREQRSVVALQTSIWRFASSHRGALLWAVGAVVLLVMAVLAHSEPLFPGDAAISAQLQRLHGTALVPVIDFPSEINQPVPGGVLAVAVIVVVAALRQVIAAIVMAVATFGTDLLNAILNGVVARPRPHGTHVQTLGGLGGHSFPSGHVEHVTMLFGFLLFLTLLARSARPERWAWLLPVQIVCVYFIALIGVGRIVEGVHQPSDVVAGYLVAALMLPLAIMFYWWLEDRWQRHKRRRWRPHIVHSA